MEKTAILLVDDDEVDRRTIMRALPHPDYDFTVQQADSVSAALDLSDTTYDAIIMDYRMPGTDGLGAIEMFRTRWPAAALVLATGQGDEDIAASAFRLGATDYVVKSLISRDVLHRVLENGIRRKKLETALEEQRKELSRFSNVLVHDFRAPVRAANFFSQCIEEDLDCGDLENLRVNAMHIRRASERMSHLINSLEAHITLDKVVEFQSASLKDLILQAVDTLRLDIAEAEGNVEVAGDFPEIACNPPQLIQLFQNLIGNALKFRGEKPARIEVDCQQTAPNTVTLRVMDHGIGVPDEKRKLIFEPFKRLRAVGDIPGTGLGLATCQKIVQRHGGTIWCDGLDGGGTTIAFTLSTSGKP